MKLPYIINCSDSDCDLGIMTQRGNCYKICNILANVHCLIRFHLHLQNHIKSSDRSLLVNSCVPHEITTLEHLLLHLCAVLFLCYSF